MRSDIFKRPTRMVHKFDAIERSNDPMGTSTFDFYEQHKRTRVSELGNHRVRSCTVQQHGEYEMFSPSRSAVEKPGGGLASISGPKPDYAEQLGAPVPVSTKKRVNHLKTDK